jgi:hypothetical protein
MDEAGLDIHTRTYNYPGQLGSCIPGPISRLKCRRNEESSAIGTHREPLAGSYP